MFNVTGIAFTVYPITDVARARGFYEGVLGLKPGQVSEPAPGIWWIEYDAGPSGVCITNGQVPGLEKHPNVNVALEVTNIDEALASLRAADVALVWGPNDYPSCRSFAFKDPDGNVLFVHQRKSPHA